MLDIDALAAEFNLDDSPVNMNQTEVEIGFFGSEEYTDPDKILAKNIAKADALLNRVIYEINQAGLSPRLGEVAGQIIANINVAAGQLYSKDFNISSLQLKSAMLKLKEREHELKEKIAHQNRPGTVNNNIIISDRESILKFLSDNKDKPKLIENTE